MSRWDLASHNKTVLTSLRLASTDWERLGELQGSLESREELLDVQRKVTVGSLPRNAHTSYWPDKDGDLMTVLCTKPGCPLQAFTRHPLNRYRAIIHFEMHDITLGDDRHVMQLFGFKGTYQVCRAGRCKLMKG